MTQIVDILPVAKPANSTLDDRIPQHHNSVSSNVDAHDIDRKFGRKIIRMLISNSIVNLGASSLVQKSLRQGIEGAIVLAVTRQKANFERARSLNPVMKDQIIRKCMNMSAKRFVMYAGGFRRVRSAVEDEQTFVDRKGESIFVCQRVRRVMLWLMIIGKNSISPVMKREWAGDS